MKTIQVKPLNFKSPLIERPHKKCAVLHEIGLNCFASTCNSCPFVCVLAHWVANENNHHLPLVLSSVFLWDGC